MNKIQSIITIIFGMVIISGCISSSENPEENDLEISISINETYFSVDSDHINISIKILNVADKDIKIYKAYELLTNHEIIGPNNMTIEQIHMYDIVADRITLKSGESKNFIDDLKSKEHRMNGSRYNWDIPGLYKITYYYSDEEASFYSNILEFEIRE